MKQIALTIIVALTMCSAFANEVAVNFVKLNEGFRSAVYTCTAGKPTIGYGFTSKKYIAMGTMTEAQADTILRGYVEACKKVVRDAVKVRLTENQEAVLIDFVYHFGSGAFKNSTLLKVVNVGQFDKVPAELSKWVKQKKIRNGKIVKINGKIQYETVQGLVNRANRRIELWNK